MRVWQRTFIRGRTGESSASLRKVYGWCSDEERRLDAAFYEEYPQGRGTGQRTPFAGIVQGPGPLAGGAALVRREVEKASAGQPASGSSLEARLRGVLGTALLDVDAEVAVAVSGGIDSWLLAALLKEAGHRVCGWYLATGVPGYCEREQVEASSRVLGIPCRFVHATAEDFVAAAADFVAAVQWPVYNLHPVSKWLFAKALQKEGVTAVVTGDAADQVMRWDWDCDLLPLTVACFQQAGIRMVLPFAADEVVRFVREPCADKQPVRELAQKLRVPVRAKRPSLFPPVALPPAPAAELPLTDAANRPVLPDRVRCLSYTTGLLQAWLESSPACAH